MHVGISGLLLAGLMRRRGIATVTLWSPRRAPAGAPPSDPAMVTLYGGCDTQSAVKCSNPRRNVSGPRRTVGRRRAPWRGGRQKGNRYRRHRAARSPTELQRRNGDEGSRRSRWGCASPSAPSCSPCSSPRCRRSTSPTWCPAWSVGTAAVARRRRAAHARRHRAVGRALAAGARGARAPRPAAPAAVALPGRPVRLQRAAHHDRRRRAAGQPPVAGHRRVAQHVRLGGARAPHRLARAAGDHRRRLRREPRRSATSARATQVALGLAFATLVALVHRARRRRQTSASAGASTPATGWRRFAGRRPPRARPAAHRPGAAANVLARRVRLPARARAGRRGGRPGARRAARPASPRCSPSSRPCHRPGAADRHLRPRRARGCVRAVPRPARRAPTRRPSPSACCSTCSTSASACSARPPSPSAVAPAPETAASRRPACDVASASRPAGDRRPAPRTAPTWPPTPTPAPRHGAPACAGGRRSLYAVAVYVVYSVVRNQFGSGAGEVDPGPPSATPRTSSSSSATSHLYFEDHLQQWYLDLPPRPDPAAGTSTTASPTSW